jgi:HEAT repeat protein
MYERAAPEEALEQLVAILNSDDPNRQYVPGRLARVPSDRALPVLVEVLARETDAEARRAISWALQKVPGPDRVVSAILAAHREGKLTVDGAVGQALVLTARRLLPEPSFGEEDDLLDEDLGGQALRGSERPVSDAQLQEVAVVVLGALRSSRSEPADREKLAEAAGWLPVAPEQVADALLETALADPNGPVRSAAANALACMKAPVEVILPRAKQIAERGDDHALSGLLKLLDHGNTPKMPGLARSLLRALEHPNHWRRQKAVSALVRMDAGDREVERAVVRRLDDEHTTVRREAARYSFRRLPAEEVCPALLRALRDESAEIWAWWSLKERAPLDVLLPAAGELLRSPGELTVNDVCGWLAQQGPAAAAIVPRLLEVLDDPSPRSRFAGIEALLAVAPSQTSAALEALGPLLSHELDAVRAEATRVRGRILELGGR